MKNNTWLLVLIVIVLALLPIFLTRGAEFEGADVIAENTIGEINPDYEPWAESLWEPPSGEIESLLFALQAALGAGFIGYYLGNKSGQNKNAGSKKPKSS